MAHLARHCHRQQVSGLLPRGDELARQHTGRCSGQYCVYSCILCDCHAPLVGSHHTVLRSHNPFLSPPRLFPFAPRPAALLPPKPHRLRSRSAGIKVGSETRADISFLSFSGLTVEANRGLALQLR